MNIKMIALASAVAVSSAIAQDLTDEQAANQAESTEAAVEEQSEDGFQVEPVTEEASKEAVAEEVTEEDSKQVAKTDKKKKKSKKKSEKAYDEQDEDDNSSAKSKSDDDDEDEDEKVAVKSKNKGKSAKKKEPSAFDVLHGNAYNFVGNEAAASTIGGDMSSPYKMAGQKLVYLEPINQYAVLAFGGSSMTYLLAFDNNDQNYGLGTVGVATKSFGLAFDFSFDKTWNSVEETEDDEKGTLDKSVTGAGDLLQLTFAAPLGGIDLTISAYWQTYKNETDSEEEVSEGKNSAKRTIDQDYWNLGGRIALSNAPSSSNFAWSFGADIVRHTDFVSTENSETRGGKTETELEEVTGEYALLYIQPYFNIGAPVLQSEKARVLLGLNTSIPLTFFDEIKDEEEFARGQVDGDKDNHSVIEVYTVPNIHAEILLGNCWMVYGGAAFNWKVFQWSSDEFIENYNNKRGDKATTNTSDITMKTEGTVVSAGARFQYENIALEASIENSFYSNPLEGFAGSNFIANVGAFINF